MAWVRIHGTRTTSKLLLGGCLFGGVAWWLISTAPNDEATMWGIGLAVLSALCFYSAVRGRS
ncbi:MAG: hypothetical protein AAGK00_00565 [Pseudomonadota bacterium]